MIEELRFIIGDDHHDRWIAVFRETYLLIGEYESKEGGGVKRTIRVIEIKEPEFDWSIKVEPAPPVERRGEK